MNSVTRRPTRRHGWVGVFVAAAALAFALAGAARAQVLEQVPSDALLVIKLNQLKIVNTKIAKFCDDMGIAALVPQMADPLGALKENLKIKEGLDDNGEVAIVMTKDGIEANDPNDAVIVLLPVTDYKAFLGNFENVATEGEVSSFKPADFPTDMYATQWGKYAVIAPKKELLANKPAVGGLKLSALASREAKEKDVFIFVNIPELSKKVLPKLEKAHGQVAQVAERETANDERAKAYAPAASAAVHQTIRIAEGFMSDATAATFGLQFGDDGITVTTTAEFKPDSYGGRLAAQVQNSDQPLFGGLPAGHKYFSAVGIKLDPKVSSTVLADLLDPIGKEMPNTNQGNGFKAAFDHLKEAAAVTNALSIGYVAPTGEIGADSVIQPVWVARGDAKAMHASYRKFVSNVSELAAKVPNGQGESPLQFTSGGKTVGDVKLDTYKGELEIDESDPRQRQFKQVMESLAGKNGLSGVFGAVSDDTAVWVQGGDDDLIAATVAAAQKPAGDAIGELAQVPDVAKQMPAKRFMAGYIFLDNIIATGVQVAQRQGLPVKLHLPPDLPPIGFATSTEGSAVRVDAVLPTKLTQQLIAAAIQMWMRMQGGEAPGGPGAL